MKKNIERFRKGYMDMLLLKVLSEGDCYGYEIICLFHKISKNVIDITVGSIYQVLYRMQDFGYITSYTQKSGPKMERIYYHITPEGRDALDEMIHDYNLVTKATADILAYTREENLLDQNAKNHEE